MDTENLTFIANEADVDSRLDTFLAAKIPNWSRARLQRLIGNEDVLVNNKKTKPSYRLRLADQLEVELTTLDSESFVPEDIPVNVVYEDDDLVVVNKPAGLVVHPASGIHSGTLANALAFHFQNLPTSSSSIRPGIVHRLDRDTSGLLVVAKNAESLENLSDQFRDRSVYKSYIALVHGRVDADNGKIDQPLARDRSNRTRMAVIRGGRGALSIYKVHHRYQRFTLLDVKLKTGRTHQIRVHLAWLRHPVVGDETYGGGRDNTIQDAKQRAHVRSLGRHFLHAERLALDHPKTGNRLVFEAPLPIELASLLAELE
ncbi:MAG TPA: RluA family pseudouridine synthase [Pyrinomonadaceae bacterium]